MAIVLLTALGVGGATVFGAVIGFIFKRVSHKFSDIMLAFAAGVMLASAVFGLIIPSGEAADQLLVSLRSERIRGLCSVGIVAAGIFAGALSISLLDGLIPHLHRLVGVDIEEHSPKDSMHINRVMLFVLAIAIHNLPEGIAAGVGFGSDSLSDAFLIAGGIALQNIPEGMVIISPMLSAGIKPSRTFLCALSTGLIEVVGTFIGYFAVSISSALLPFALAFAGGTMIYVVSDEMIPETHAHGSERGATYALLAGFCLMLFMDVLI